MKAYGINQLNQEPICLEGYLSTSLNPISKSYEDISRSYMGDLELLQWTPELDVLADI